MKNLVLFGGTGGLGSQLKVKLDVNYNIMSLGSKDVDITNYNEVKDFFLGNDVDIVVNLSGYNYNAFLHKYSNNNLAERQKLIDINIIGSLNILSNCLLQMRNKNYGRIILISSILSSKPVVGTSVYSASKAFIDNLAKTCTLENLSKGITCNTLQLGYMDGGLTYEIPEPFRTKIKETILLKRWGSINELENTVRYLINTEYISGCSIKLNGGLDF